MGGVHPGRIYLRLAVIGISLVLAVVFLVDLLGYRKSAQYRSLEISSAVSLIVSDRLDAISRNSSPGVLDSKVFQSALNDIDAARGRTITLFDSSFTLLASQPLRESLPSTELALAADLAYRLSVSGLHSMEVKKASYLCVARKGQNGGYVVVDQRLGDALAWWYGRASLDLVLALSMLALVLVLFHQLSAANARNSEFAARSVAMDSASDAIVIADLEGRVQYVNPSYETITGMPKGKVLGSHLGLFGLSGAEADAALASVARGQLWRGEVETTRGDGQWIVEEATVAPVPGEDGEPVQLVAVIRDVTERRRLHERLERLAHYDPLTGLPNRALFFDRLEGAIARARRESRMFALLYLDLDGFKAVNDSHGHDAGDYLLFEIAKRLRLSIRDSDTAGRMGGDEFTVLLENIAQKSDAVSVARKIKASISEPAQLPSAGWVRVGASVGIAVFPDDGDGVESILKAADSSMYAAKLSPNDALP